MFYPVTELEKQMFLYGMKGLVKSAYIYGTDKNGATIEILNDDLRMGTFAIDRYCCNGEKLEVGTAIASQLSFTLDNSDGRYNNIVFEGTELTVEIIISAPTAGVHYLSMGLFTPDEQPRRLKTIKITALDRMTKFDAVVDATQLTFPATVAGLVGQVCGICGVTLAESISGLPNASLSIAALPSSSSEITYRNLIQWCAGLMATNAWIDWLGKLRFNWYNNTVETVIDEDIRFDGDVYEDDLTITGAMYTNNSGVTIVEGTDDYAIDLTGNLLLGPVIATALPIIANAVQGFTYRPYEASTLPLPYLWPMDSIAYKVGGVTHASTLTNVVFGINGGGTLAAQGMTYAMNQRKQGNPLTKDQAQLVNEVAHSVEVLDESLDQQEIFDRLTDNGTAQGIVLYNGQLYINASYVNAGIINGDLVKAKKLVILDSNNEEVASFDSVLVLGNADENHAEITPGSFRLYDGSDAVYMSAGDARDENGDLTRTYTGDGTTFKFFLMPYPESNNITGISKVTVDGATVYGQLVYEGGGAYVLIGGTAPASGSTVQVWFAYSQPIMHYTLGVRQDGALLGDYSTAEGTDNAATGDNSHAEGANNTAAGAASHAEGNGNTASGDNSHVEGDGNIARGPSCHAEGVDTEAGQTVSHTGAHAEGNGTQAYGNFSHAEGNDTLAYGDYSHVEGEGTVAGSDGQHVFGRYNIRDANDEYAEIVGNGSGANSRANARTLDWDGNETLAGGLNVGDDIIQTDGYIKGSNESNTNHAIKLGHNNDNVMAFYEYGGQFDFVKSRGGTDTTLFQVRDGDSAAPLPVNNGGTGVTTQAVTITNDYSSILNVINAVKDTRIFPISVQKAGGSSYNDMPSGYDTKEWNMLLIGDAMRMTTLLFIFSGQVFSRIFYNGSWLTTWAQIY